MSHRGNFFFFFRGSFTTRRGGILGRDAEGLSTHGCSSSPPAPRAPVCGWRDRDTRAGDQGPGTGEQGAGTVPPGATEPPSLESSAQPRGGTGGSLPLYRTVPAPGVPGGGGVGDTQRCLGAHFQRDTGQGQRSGAAPRRTELGARSHRHPGRGDPAPVMSPMPRQHHRDRSWGGGGWWWGGWSRKVRHSHTARCRLPVGESPKKPVRSGKERVNRTRRATHATSLSGDESSSALHPRPSPTSSPTQLFLRPPMSRSPLAS